MVQGNQTDLGGSKRRFRTMLSRRGVMTAAMASAALALGRMGKPETALAGVDGDVVLGASNNSTSTTTISKTSGPTPGLTVFGAQGDAINGISTTNIGVNAAGLTQGVLGATTTANGVGVLGTVFGQSLGQGVLGSCATAIGIWGNSTSNIGVLASSQSTHAVFGSSAGASASGVFGTNTSAQGVGVGGSSGPGIGVSASSTTSVGLFATSSSSTAVVGRTTSGKAAEFFGNVEITGDFTASGLKSAAVKTADGQVRRMYCLESPVSFFEDIGTAEIVNGHADVALEPLFASTVDTSDYNVYLTPEEDCRGLYVESKSPTGFSVRELMGGTSRARFSWRVVAKRTGITNERLAPVKMSTDPNSGPRLAPQHVVEIPQLPPTPNVLERPR